MTVKRELFWAFFLLISHPAAAQNILELAPLPGHKESRARGINELGQVVGYSSPGGKYKFEDTTALLWTEGEITQIGPFGDPESGTEAFALNDQGSVACRQTDECGPYTTPWSFALAWDGSVAENLFPEAQNCSDWPQSFAYSINESGKIVGFRFRRNPELPPGFRYVYEAFLWERGLPPHWLGVPSGSGVFWCNPQAFGINEGERIVGGVSLCPNFFQQPSRSQRSSGLEWDEAVYASLSWLAIFGQGSIHACEWQEEIPSLLPELPSWSESVALSVNDAGETAGTILDSEGRLRAARWGSDRQATEIETLGGENAFACGINNWGQAVGSSQVSNGEYHAFLWNPATGTLDLNLLLPGNSEWELLEANGINDSGQIVGVGKIHGELRGFLLLFDCNQNGIPDPLDIQHGTSQDCNQNEIPDECELALGLDGDCNANGVLDGCDVRDGTSPDCNRNGKPDECDLQDGTSQDCQGNGIPDECELCAVDVVFVMDSSASMGAEFDALCSILDLAGQNLLEHNIQARTTVLGIVSGDSGDGCLEGNILNMFGAEVPGADYTLDSCYSLEDSNEDWAPATAVIAARYPWKKQARRLIVPISDEGPRCGNPCDDPGEDQEATDLAISVCRERNVHVFPITAKGSNDCVKALAQRIASETGGFSTSTELYAEGEALRQAILDALVQAALQSCDCNLNGVPDECDIAGGLLHDQNRNNLPDECEEELVKKEKTE